MLTPQETGLLQTASLAFREFSTQGLGTFGPETLERLAGRNGMSKKWIGLGPARAFGYEEAGHVAIAKLARSLRSGRGAGLRQTSGPSLERALATLLAALLCGRAPGRLSGQDLDQINQGIANWFGEQVSVRTHYVPCRITPSHERPFTIGPVDFFHISAFTQPGFDPDLAHAHSFAVDSMLEFMRDRACDWIARVRVPGHERRASEETAGLMVDVALGGLALALPIGPYEGMGRGTGRLPPVHWPSLSVSDGSPSGGSHVRQPGRAVSQGGFGTMLAQQAHLLQCIGGRISGFLGPGNAHAVLDEAWCNAAFWFHAATLEALPAVALTQLETTIEVLFRTEKSKGSTTRLTTALKLFFNLAGKARMPGSNLTADEFVEFVVAGRSRVLHGTWPTLDRDLPLGSGGEIVSIDYVRSFTASLLRRVARAMEAYDGSGGSGASTSDFFEWVEGRTDAVSEFASEE